MAIVNTDFYDNIVAQIEAIPDCITLQAQADKIIASLQEQLQAAQDQLAKVQPIAKLLDPPTSPDEVIDWINGLIESVIKPLAAPTTIYQIQIAEMVIGISRIVDALKNKADSITNCEINIL